MWQADWPLSLSAVLLPFRRGAGDPTHRVAADGTHWLGMRTDLGPVSLALGQPSGRGGAVTATAWGSGSELVLERLPRLLGAEDDPTGFVAGHPVLEETLRRTGVPRFGRTDRVFEALVPSVLEQKVTGQEAFAGYRSVVTAHGEPGPGAPPGLRLWIPPTPEALRAVPSWQWLAHHVDQARSRTVVGAAARARALDRIVDLAGPGAGAESERRLTSLPGVGEWTAAEVRRRALGDPDAVSFGDYHVATQVGFALTGEAMDDDRLREFLEPWRGHRARVVALVWASGVRPARRGPRMAPRTHLPAPTPGTTYRRRRR